MPEAPATNWPRRLHRAPANPLLRLGMFAVIALAASWRPLGEAGAVNEFRDWHLVHPYEDVAVRTVLEYGELPLWNPWSCGGMYALGNPQTRFASPTFLVSLVLGARRAEPVLLFLFLLLGMEGMFRFARLRSVDSLAPFLIAPMFALTGYGAVGWTLGWMGFTCGFLLVPWTLYGTARLARGDAMGAIPLVASAGTMLGMGSSYPLALAAVFAALESVRGLGPIALRRRFAEAGRRAGLLAVAGLLCAGALAVRLWPIAETMRASPRIMAGAPRHGIDEIVSMLFAPAQGASGTRASFAVAPMLALLALAALPRLRKSFAPLLLFVFAVWCATGYATSSPYTWLRHLPVFETLRYPERFLFPGAVYLAEAGSIGVSALLALARTRRFRVQQTAIIAGTAGLALAGIVYAVVSYEALMHRTELGPMPPRVEQPFAQARGNRWIAGHFPALNRGSISCGEAFPVWMSPALRGDLPREEYLAESDAGSVERARWSPNRVELDVTLNRAASVRVNQNWHPGWRASEGTIESADGLLAVQLPAGRSRVVLSFRPRSATGGAAVSALGLLAIGAWVWVERKRPRWSLLAGLGLAAIPLGAWAALAATSSEPAQRPRISNQDGSPILVDAIPEDARPPDLRFDLLLELAAVRIPERPEENAEVPIELYWRVTGDVPRTLGIFIHIVGPDGKRHSADHEVVGGTWFFKKAPRDRLLRDVARVNTSDWAEGEWKVRLGLWHASGDGTRVPAFTRAGAPLRDGFAEIATIRIEKASTP